MVNVPENNSWIVEIALAHAGTWHRWRIAAGIRIDYKIYVSSLILRSVKLKMVRNAHLIWNLKAMSSSTVLLLWTYLSDDEQHRNTLLAIFDFVFVILKIVRKIIDMHNRWKCCRSKRSCRKAADFYWKWHRKNAWATSMCQDVIASLNGPNDAGTFHSAVSRFLFICCRCHI